MTLHDVIIRPMGQDFLLWRCLHGGPLSAANLGSPPAVKGMNWNAFRERNMPLLAKLIQTYGTCAMLAWDRDRVVGFVRFYPKALADLATAGGMCLQQVHPNGPSDALLGQGFPLLADLPDRTLSVHCLMTGSPLQKKNSYQRKGLGTRLVRALIGWAAEQGWDAVEAIAYEEIPAIYEITGQAGWRWWERLGFEIVGVDSEPGMEGGFLDLVRRQADELGLPQDRVTNRYTMRLVLGR